MTTAPFLQSSFAGGVLGRSLWGRTDLDRYPVSLALCHNALPAPGGSVASRPGTRYLAHTHENRPARLLPFSFSAEQSYAVEVTAGTMRFYRDRALIQDAGSPVEVACPWALPDLQAISVAQSADTLILVCRGHEPRVLSRLSDTNWTLSPLVRRDGPYGPVNTAATTMQVTSGTLTAGSTGTVITASAALFASTDVGRLIRLRANNNAGDWGWVTITGYTSPTVVTVTVGDRDLIANLATTPSVVWRLGAFSGTTGWPEAVSYSGGRLWLGATLKQPQTLFGSVAGDFQRFDPTRPDGPVVDDSALVLTLDDDRVNKVEWLLDQQGALLVGTSGGEFVVRARSSVEAVTATNLGAFRQSTHGSARGASAVKVGPAVLFVERGSGAAPVLPGNGSGGGRAVRELVFSFEVDQYLAADVSRVAPELAEAAPLATASAIRFDAAGSGGIVDLAVAQGAATTVWAVRADGVLLSLLYDREQRLAGWATHTLGGSMPDGLGRQAGAEILGDPEGFASARVESIAVVRDQAAARDLVYLSVARMVDGQTVRFVEVLEPEPAASARADGDACLDAQLRYDGWNTDPALTVTLTDLGSGRVQIDASAAIFSDPQDEGRVLAVRTPAQAASLEPAYFSALTIDGVESATRATAAVNESDTQVQDLIAAGATALWGWAARTLSGLDHLEGQTVGLLLDGAEGYRAVVEGGAVDLSAFDEELFAGGAVVAICGLECPGLVRTLPIAAATSRLDSRGRKVALKRLVVHVERATLTLRGFALAAGIRLGEAARPADPVSLRDTAAPTGAAPRRLRGRISMLAPTGMAEDTQIQLERGGPAPMRLLELSATVEVE